MSEVPQRFCVILSILNQAKANGESDAQALDNKTEIQEDVRDAMKFGSNDQNRVRVFGGFVSFDQVKTEVVGRQNWLKRVSCEHTIRMQGPSEHRFKRLNLIYAFALDREGLAEVSCSLDADSTEAPLFENDAESDSESRKGLEFIKRGVESAKG